MAKHKPMCILTMVLLIVGGLNWGLVGLGGFVGRNLNVVNLILGTWPTVEWIVYLLVGLSALMMLWVFVTMKECGCEKMGK